MCYNRFMKKVAILYKDYSPIIDAIKYELSDCQVDCLTSSSAMDKYDIVINFGINYDGEALTCHHSLLPAFDSKEPVKDAILAGVKVTGVTIYYTKSKRIIAQYPIFIDNSKHYDEIKQEILYIEQVLLPIVAKKILDNKPFDVRTIINGGCGHNCGGCSACSH